MFKTFIGGVHPEENKFYTANIPIRTAKPPDSVTIPMVQHTGAPCTPIVKVGEAVKKGQTIGLVEQFITSPVHASISGTVKEIKNLPHPVIDRSLSVVIASDGKDEWADDVKIRDDVEGLSRDEIVDIVKGECRWLEDRVVGINRLKIFNRLSTQDKILKQLDRIPPAIGCDKDDGDTKEKRNEEMLPQLRMGRLVRGQPNIQELSKSNKKNKRQSKDEPAVAVDPKKHDQGDEIALSPGRLLRGLEAPIDVNDQGHEDVAENLRFEKSRGLGHEYPQHADQPRKWVVPKVTPSGIPPGEKDKQEDAQITKSEEDWQFSYSVEKVKHYFRNPGAVHGIIRGWGPGEDRMVRNQSLILYEVAPINHLPPEISILYGLGIAKPNRAKEHDDEKDEGPFGPWLW